MEQEFSIRQIELSLSALNTETSFALRKSTRIHNFLQILFHNYNVSITLEEVTAYGHILTTLRHFRPDTLEPVFTTIVWNLRVFY